MTGVPLVGSVAGGTGEILIEGLSWPIVDIENVSEYEAAIHAVLADPTAARARARRLRDLLVAQRTRRAFRNALETVLIGEKP
jgi:glycosyltransferase involved in cell wall biosynthesis